jgi:hypothetical protein
LDGSIGKGVTFDMADAFEKQSLAGLDQNLVTPLLSHADQARLQENMAQIRHVLQAAPVRPSFSYAAQYAGMQLSTMLSRRGLAFRCGSLPAYQIGLGWWVACLLCAVVCVACATVLQFCFAGVMWLLVGLATYEWCCPSVLSGLFPAQTATIWEAALGQKSASASASSCDRPCLVLCGVVDQPSRDMLFHSSFQAMPFQSYWQHGRYLLSCLVGVLWMGAWIALLQWYWPSWQSTWVAWGWSMAGMGIAWGLVSTRRQPQASDMEANALAILMEAAMRLQSRELDWDMRLLLVNGSQNGMGLAAWMEQFRQEHGTRPLVCVCVEPFGMMGEEERVSRWGVAAHQGHGPLRQMTARQLLDLEWSQARFASEREKETAALVVPSLTNTIPGSFEGISLPPFTQLMRLGRAVTDSVPLTGNEQDVQWSGRQMEAAVQWVDAYLYALVCAWEKGSEDL